MVRAAFCVSGLDWRDRELVESEVLSMRKVLAFYTVVCDRKGYPFKYIDPETSYLKTFRGPFSDPGEASQEFQMALGGAEKCCYLDEQQFQGKARALAQLRRAYTKKLNIGR